MANISDLRFDDKNFNAHTEYGMPYEQGEAPGVS